MNLHSGISVSSMKRLAYTVILFYDDPVGCFIDKDALTLCLCRYVNLGRFRDADSEFTAIFNEALKINGRN